MTDEIDWTEAEAHLDRCERAYAQIGSEGYFALIHVIRPVRDRFNKGERTDDLYAEIMGINL